MDLLKSLLATLSYLDYNIMEAEILNTEAFLCSFFTLSHFSNISYLGSFWVISIAQLSVSQRLHLQPINVIISNDPYIDISSRGEFRA